MVFGIAVVMLVVLEGSEVLYAFIVFTCLNDAEHFLAHVICLESRYKSAPDVTGRNRLKHLSS